MKYLFKLILILLITQPVFSADKTAKFEPPQNKTLLFVGQDNATIEQYLNSVKSVPAGFMLYTSIQAMDGLYGKSADYGAGIMFADKLINKYPNTMLQIGLYMVDALKDTYEGKYDNNIEKLADWLNKIKIPVFLRIGYEFDGPHNHYDPEEYKKAYHYLADKLRARNVTNVAYVWHSTAYKLKPDLDIWYPGDDYVDWVGVTFFDQPKSGITPVITYAKAHNKPVMVCEGTPKDIGTIGGKASWNIWYKPFFDYVNKNGIKAICYINSDWDNQAMYKGQHWKDARVQSNKYIKTSWLEEINKEQYLRSSDNLFKELGFEINK
jgi:hypothetical protein